VKISNNNSTYIINYNDTLDCLLYNSQSSGHLTMAWQTLLVSFSEQIAVSKMAYIQSKQ